MKGLGYTLLVLGLGAQILPHLGLQFKIVNALSDSGISAWQISLLFIVGGIILLFISSSPQKDISQARSIQKPVGIEKRQNYLQERNTVDPDVALIQSGLTQAVIADIALGTDKNTTISTLVAIGMPESKAKAYVDVLLASFMDFPEERREEIRKNMQQRMEIIDEALSKGLSEEVIAQILIRAEGFTRQQAEAIVSYSANVYKFRKS